MTEQELQAIRERINTAYEIGDIDFSEISLYEDLLDEVERLRKALEEIHKLTLNPNKPCRGDIAVLVIEVLEVHP